jgi:hypothetical protein
MYAKEMASYRVDDLVREAEAGRRARIAKRRAARTGVVDGSGGSRPRVLRFAAAMLAPLRHS